MAINGCFCGSGSSCYPDGCTRKTIKADGSIDYGLCGSAGCGGAYNCCYDTNSTDANRYFCTQQPPCCTEMVQRNDPEACCWPERGYCHPFYCNQMSRPEQCGWYWRWHSNAPDMMARGYGCIIGTTEQNMHPLYGLPPGVPGGGNQPTPTNRPQPSATPRPQNTPTRTPTNRPQPTTPQFPTNPPLNPTNPPVNPTNPPVNPTNPPLNQNIPPLTNPPMQNQNQFAPTVPPQQNEPTQSRSILSLPQIQMPVVNLEPLKVAARKTIIAAEKPLSLFEQLFYFAANLDQSLENYITNALPRFNK